MCLYAHVLFTKKQPSVFIVHSGIGARLGVKYRVSNCSFVAETFGKNKNNAQTNQTDAQGQDCCCFLKFQKDVYEPGLTHLLQERCVFVLRNMPVSLVIVIALAALRLCELSVHIPVKQKTQQSIDGESVPTVPLQHDKMPWTE